MSGIILAGDIGGTKTHLALFDGIKILKEEKFPSHSFRTFDEILKKFQPEDVTKACFGISGPILDDTVHTTNLPWIIDRKKLQKQLAIDAVYLINDLEATAWGIRCLTPADVFVLNEGSQKNGNKAVIAAGTGLGEAGLFWDGKNHHPFACEGGHVDFAARDEQEELFCRYLRKKYGHVSYERVLSGPGLESLFWFLVENSQIQETIDNINTPKQITELGMSGKSQLCRETLDWFVSIYGAAAGNLALKFKALGGVYIGGGIVPKIYPIFQDGFFMRSFVSKGRFDGFLRNIPVKLILNERAALLGAAEFARRGVPSAI